MSPLLLSLLFRVNFVKPRVLVFAVSVNEWICSYFPWQGLNCDCANKDVQVDLHLNDQSFSLRSGKHPLIRRINAVLPTSLLCFSFFSLPFSFVFLADYLSADKFCADMKERERKSKSRHNPFPYFFQEEIQREKVTLRKLYLSQKDISICIEKFVYQEPRPKRSTTSKPRFSIRRTDLMPVTVASV